MKVRAPLSAVLMVVLGLADQAGQAANPLVELRLRNVTAAEAAVALSRAAGVPVRVVGGGLKPPPDAPRDIVKADDGPQAPSPPRFSFQWSRVPFSQALRELCQRAGLRPGASSDRTEGYALGPAGEGLAPNWRAPNALVFRSARASLLLQAALARRSPSAHFAPVPNAATGGGSLSLEVLAELPGDEGMRVAGIANLSAQDDRGQVLVRTSLSGGASALPHGLLPDEWRGLVSLPAPHTKASRLLWLEGDLLAYAEMEPFRLELPLPKPGAQTRQHRGEAVAMVYWEPDPQPDRSLIPGFGGVNPNLASPSLRVQVMYRRSHLLTDQLPRAVGASGKRYPVERAGHRSASGGNGDLFSTEQSIRLPEVDDPIVSLAWEFVRRSRPVRLTSFRFTNIPLPAAE
jgi:hypothetical protein